MRFSIKIVLPALVFSIIVPLASSAASAPHSVKPIYHYGSVGCYEM